MSNSIYLFVDTETTGLNYESDNSTIRDNKLLQISYKLYDYKIENVLLEDNIFIKYTKPEIVELISEMNDYVFKMHSSTGLLYKLENYENNKHLKQIDEELYNNLLKYNDFKIIPAGNNIGFDVEVIRRNLPLTASLLHYSFLDVSAIRNSFETIGSDFGSKVKQKKLSNHDALVDIEECVKEFKQYQKILTKGLRYKFLF